MITKEDIAAGESQNVEFKEMLPEKSIKWMKSVVAFANGSGGKVVFGVDDSGAIVGMDKDGVLKTCDAIANAISDSCSPGIIPDISLHTLEGKSLIVVDIEPGRQRPYFIKSAGVNAGTYVRVGGTSRLADESMIRELMFEGNNRSYDQALCMDMKVTHAEAEALCRVLTETARRNAPEAAANGLVKELSVRHLVSWGVLQEREGALMPTNAYAVLVGDESMPTGIQCGVFKGSNKSVFVDRREFHGAVQEQIEEAYQFVLRNIHLGATFQGVYRDDVYEIPPDVIRELIINAVVHRSYLDRNKIQVAIFDDRLEVTSPGRLPFRQSFQRMKEGYSKIRNEALAHAFSYMNLIEHWGSGIPRIMSRVAEAGLPEPDFQDGDTDVRISIHRRMAVSGQSVSAAKAKNGTKAVKQESLVPELLALLVDKPDITQETMARHLGVTRRVVTRVLSNLQENGTICRQGHRRRGQWVVMSPV